MRKNRTEIDNILRGLMLAAALLFVSCALGLEKAKPEATGESKMPVEEQEERAAEKFRDILDIVMGAPDRASVLPDLELAYREIITEYPDSSVVHESYWRLITMSLEDYIPPRIDNAETVYKEFSEKYPNSFLKNAIDDTMVRFYYKSGQWERLRDFCVPAMREYVKSGKLGGPLYMFFYSESKFNLGDYVEAGKGYRTLLRYFPKSQEARVAAERLEEIRSRKSKSGSR